MLHLPPSVALLLTIGFVFFLFRRDIRERPNVTGAIWIPVLWMLFIGSKSPMQWLDVLGLTKARLVEEGNPLDALIYFGLILAGLAVLGQRRVSLSEVIRNNGWLIAFLLYCFIAIVWSDFPFVAFKRWIKVLGHPVMVLILFTEPDFEEGLVRLIKRAAYILVPFNILAIKYYPDIGRGFDEWTGEPMNLGIAQSKNSLGCVCLVLGFFFFYQLLKTWPRPRDIARRNELRLIVGFLLMIWWLLAKAHSATSFLSFVLAMTIMLLLGRQWVNKRLIGTYVILAVVLLVTAELSFGIFERLVDLTGHGTTLNGRAELWRQLLALHTNPVFGVGFESFWLGDRSAPLLDNRLWHPDEAHNGYLEIYLDLGLIGLSLLVALIIATFRKVRLELLRNPEWGGFRLALLAVIVFHNWTESSFKGLSLLWFAFYIIALDYAEPEYESTIQPSDDIVRDEELRLVYFPE